MLVESNLVNPGDTGVSIRDYATLCYKGLLYPSIEIPVSWNVVAHMLMSLEPGDFLLIKVAEIRSVKIPRSKDMTETQNTVQPGGHIGAFEAIFPLEKDELPNDLKQT